MRKRERRKASALVSIFGLSRAPTIDLLGVVLAGKNQGAISPHPKTARCKQFSSERPHGLHGVDQHDHLQAMQPPQPPPPGNGETG